MFGNGSSSIKFFKRLNIYKNASNTVSFDPESLVGRSYNWEFCQKVFGVVLFNEYHWSPTTSNHQYAVRDVLKNLKIKYTTVNLGRYSPEDLEYRPNEVMKTLFKELVEVQIAVDTSSRIETWTYKNRCSDLAQKQKAYALVESLHKSLVLKKADKDKIVEGCIESELDIISARCSDSVFKFLTLKRAGLDTAPIAI